MKLATVVRIVAIESHPNADRLEVIRVSASGRIRNGLVDYYPEITTLVAGLHYREGDLGLYIPARALIPGYLAHQEMWLAGRGKAMEWFPIVAKNMRGIESPGIFSGQFFRNDREKPEFCKACHGQGSLDEWHEDAREHRPVTCPICKGQHKSDVNWGWTKWSYWCDWWKVGDDVAAYLGIIPEAP